MKPVRVSPCAMRHLTVSAPVRAPSGFTLAYVRSYFQERTQGVNATPFSLRLPLYALNAGRLSVEKPVSIETHYVSNDDAPDTIQVSWTPEGTMAFPSFDGSLAAKTDGDARCLLVLSGSYVAPGGIAGAAFDALLGGNIARASIEGLLQQLAAAAEVDYRTRVAL